VKVILSTKEGYISCLTVLEELYKEIIDKWRKQYQVCVVWKDKLLKITGCACCHSDDCYRESQTYILHIKFKDNLFLLFLPPYNTLQTITVF